MGGKGWRFWRELLFFEGIVFNFAKLGMVYDISYFWRVKVLEFGRGFSDWIEI